MPESETRTGTGKYNNIYCNHYDVGAFELTITPAGGADDGVISVTSPLEDDDVDDIDVVDEVEEDDASVRLESVASLLVVVDGVSSIPSILIAPSAPGAASPLPSTLSQ
jgi:hypothetical protein